MEHVYAIAIGSNQPHGRHGSPVEVVTAAIQRLEREFSLFRASSIVINPADGFVGRNFANAVALIEAPLDPMMLLRSLKGIEREFGRRAGRRWRSRVLDLDIVAWGCGTFRSRTLTIPHRHMERRAFVLEPLAEIAPGWPVRGHLTVRHLAARLARRAPRR